MSDEGLHSKPEYQDVLTRNFGEGGFTFLKRALQKCLETGQPVIINSGENYLSYEFKEGQKTFADGIQLLNGNDQEALDKFKEVANRYDIERGRREILG